MKKTSVEVPGVVTLKTSSGGVAVAATVTYNATTKQVVIDPNVRLARNTVYTAKITTAATDRVGNKLDQDSTTSGNQARTWKFTTAN
jgi:Bacterial Ig-like domain